MNFATWSIRQPIPSLVVFFLLCLAGLYGFHNLSIQDMPDMEFPAVVVSASLEGASPGQLETEVTRKIENALASITEVEHITSIVTDGASSTTIQFVLGKDLMAALNDVRSAVSNLRADLPAAMREPAVTKVSTSGRPIQIFSVSSERLSEEQRSWFVDNTVTRRLLAIPGVGSVTRLGGVNREIRVELDPTQLAALNVSAAEISRQLKKVQQQSSGGRAEIGTERQALRTIGAVERAEDLAALNISLADGRRMRLDQIATVADTVAERSQLALLDGKEVVAFQVQRAVGYGVVEVADAVRAAVAELNDLHPGVVMQDIVNLDATIRHEYRSSMLMLLEGAVLAVLVVFVFLRDWRATWIAATALPLSIIPTFGAMYFLGFSLNVITLMALSLVIGLLVDDAIVEIENIVRHLRAGKSPVQAAKDAATEIGLAVIATSISLVAVFLPTAVMGGIPGLMFKQFGWTAVVAVLASLAVARMLTPMLCSRLLQHHRGQPEHSRILETYLDLVRWSLAHRKTTVLAALGFFLGSLLLIPLLPQEFVPTRERDETQVTIELPPGSTLQDTLHAVEQVLAIARADQEIGQVFATLGTGGASPDSFSAAAGAGDVRQATVRIQFLPQRTRNSVEIEHDLRQALRAIPGARFTLGAGYFGEKVDVMLAGDDPSTLDATAHRLVTEMREIPGLGYISSSVSLLRPEIIIEPDASRAAELGVTTSTIGETVHVATAGDYGPALAKFNLPERQLDIRVQLTANARQDLETLRNLRVPGRYGLVALSSVADVRLGSGSAQISRFDRSRNVTVSAELGTRFLGEVNQTINTLPVMRALPVGVHRVTSGESEQMQEMMGSFSLAIITGVLCVYMVLVLLFKDFMQPITILVALPLSVGGAFMALLLLGKTMSMPVLIGLLLLMGIASKNSILLVEYAVASMRDRGLNEREALLEACRKRARPIVMTTLAMAAGMMPVALGLDAANSFRSPMAVAVIGGLLTSTVLSLVVVPVVFTYVLHISQRLLRWLPGADQPARVPVPVPVPVPAD